LPPNIANSVLRAAQPRVRPATHDGTKSGRPVLFSDAVWQRKLRDQGDATIACQQLLNPLAGSVRVFDVEDLQEYEMRPDARPGSAGLAGSGR
jgi:hypothetical protein